MTFLSLFADIGDRDLALTRLGMRCVGQVEIDPVCYSILARHFPEVVRHDDVRTTIAWWHAQPQPPVELICAGWPFQDLSQAGRRAGLAGARTGPVTVRGPNASRERTPPAFADDWTAVDTNHRPISDAVRYRAIDDVVAVPVIAWIGRRLLAAYHKHAYASRQRCRSGPTPPFTTIHHDAAEVRRA